MATGRSTQLTGLAGEHLVAAELCRRGFVATTFAGNVPGFDILGINEQSKKPIFIQVKTIRKGSWQFNAKKFLDISQSGDIQTVHGKTKLANPDLIYVFVKLGGQNQDEFYICKQKILQDIIYEGYSEWLSAKGGKRPKNPKSFHCRVRSKNLEHHRNDWNIITGLTK